MKRVPGRILPLLAAPLLTVALVGASGISASAVLPADGGSAPASKSCSPTPPLLRCQPPSLFTAPKTKAGSDNQQLHCQNQSGLIFHCGQNPRTTVRSSSPQPPAGTKNAARLIVNGVICDEGTVGRRETDDKGQTWTCQYSPIMGLYVWL